MRTQAISGIDPGEQARRPSRAWDIDRLARAGVPVLNAEVDHEQVPRLASRLSIWLFHHLDTRLVAVDYATFHQPVTHQVEQGLQVFAALDNSTCQGLSWNIDAVTTEYLFEAMQWQAIDVFGGQQHRQHTGAGHALFDQLRWLVSGDRRGFTTTARVDLAEVFCIGTISSCSLVFSPMACLRLPLASGWLDRCRADPARADGCRA